MTDDTRQPLTVDVILSQAMEKLGVDTPTDMLRAVCDMVDRLNAIDSAPVPLLVVYASGKVKLRSDVTVFGVMSISDALKNLPAVGGSA